MHRHLARLRPVVRCQRAQQHRRRARQQRQPQLSHWHLDVVAAQSVDAPRLASDFAALTSILILHPIAGGLVGLSIVIALLAVIPALAPAAASWAAWLAGFGTLIALLATIFDLVVFTIAVNKINGVNRTVGNATVTAQASYGPAVWMTLAAFVLGCFAAGFLIWAARVARRSRAERRSRARGRYTIMGTSGDAEKAVATDDWVYRHSYHEAGHDLPSPVAADKDVVVAPIARPARVAVPSMAERSVPTSPTAVAPLSPSTSMHYASRPTSQPTSPVERSQPMIAQISTPVDAGLSSYHRAAL